MKKLRTLRLELVIERENLTEPEGGPGRLATARVHEYTIPVELDGVSVIRDPGLVTTTIALLLEDHKDVTNVGAESEGTE